jgi:LAO/AO transport system kinase
VSLADDVLAGDRRALARAITLVESTRDDHRDEAGELLASVLPATGRAVRVGVSGTPGVGKSTFIDAIGSRLVEEGRRLAVLAVDPSSQRSGGSILGDKTRMARLSSHEHAFIRPSPAGSTLGGVARRTREALLLCEAAGFDIVLVETVGVGQSEVAVAGMVDTFLLLLAPGGGDELQGIKRGVMELADVVAVNKADGDLAAAARHSAADHRAALHLVRPRVPAWKPQVVLCSAATGAGLEDVWSTVERHRETLVEAGELDRLRADQAVDWLWADVGDRLLSAARRHPDAAALVEEVRAGRLPPSTAAAKLLATFDAEVP